MSVLTANGINIPIAPGQAHTRIVRVGGDSARGINGGLRSSSRATKREIELMTPPLLAADAELFAQFIDENANGAWFPFDSDGYSSRGNPTTTVTHIAFGGSGPTSSTAAANNASGGSIVWVFDPGFANWTVSAWVYGDAAGESWADGSSHYVTVSSAGHKIVDGVQNDSADTSWLTVVGSTGHVTVTFTKNHSSVSDLVILPFSLSPAQMIAGFAEQANQDSAFPALPWMACAGDVLLSGAGTFIGEVTDIEAIHCGPEIRHVVHFMLKEV